MKILHGDSHAKEGINFVCRCCHCEFQVQDKNDWEIHKVYDFDPKTCLYNYDHIVNDYAVSCPNCGYQEWLGVCYKESKYTSKYHSARYQWIFDREDWMDRFAVLYDDGEEVYE